MALLVLVCGAFGYHFSMTWIYLLPMSSPSLAYGPQADDYLFPLFGQTWALFAPDPPLVDASLEFQCRDADGTKTEWLNLHDDLRRAHRAVRFTPATYLRRLERSAILAARGTRDAELDHLLSKLEDGDDEFREYVAQRVSARAQKSAVQARFSYGLAVDHCRGLGAVDAVRIRIVSSDIPKFSERNAPEEEREWTSDPFPWVTVDEIRLLGAESDEFEISVEQLMSTREKVDAKSCEADQRVHTPEKVGHD